MGRHEDKDQHEIQGDGVQKGRPIPKPDDGTEGTGKHGKGTSEK